jgi:hypothetical protein
MTRVEVTRHVAADPASVALLLAGPPVEPDGGGWVILLPRRMGVGFAAAAQSSALSDFSAGGDVSVVPAADDGCEVRFVATVGDDASAGRVERSAARFLASLADRARARSFAA